MAVDVMIRQNPLPEYSEPLSKNEVWRYDKTLSAPGNSNPILIPNGVEKILARFIPSGGGTGKVQTSISTIALIRAGTATWEDWSAGSVSTLTSDVSERVNAIRLVNSAGTTVLELLAY